MFVRVSCDRCRVLPAWTDDPAAILEGGCRHPAGCAARFLNDELAVVPLDPGGGPHSFPRLPPFPRSTTPAGVVLDSVPSGFWPIIVPCITALLVSLALASAYESAAILPILVELAAPPLVALLLYRSSANATVVALLCLAGAAFMIDVLGVGPLSANPLNGLLLVGGAVAGPLLVDLELTDLGRMLRWDALSGAWTTSTFVAVTALLLTVELPSANHNARREDEAIVRRLVPRLKMQGSSLVLDRLDPRLAKEAERGLVILAAGRRYELSGESAETVVAQKSATIRGGRDGVANSHRAEHDPKELVTLVLPLRGPQIPTEVEIEGVRGPATTYETKVALAK
ncbi:MAG: hypothetical protein ABW298_15735 [Candidatus Binatia bacterium]